MTDPCTTLGAPPAFNWELLLIVVVVSIILAIAIEVYFDTKNALKDIRKDNSELK